MLVYGGIDEAGYGPMFGPLLVSRSVFAIDDLNPPGPSAAPGAAAGADAADPAALTAAPDLWKRLKKAVCKQVAKSKQRLAINDSKKVYSGEQGLRRLELGVLCFAALAGKHPATVDAYLDALGETAHHDLAEMPWYQPLPQRPWAALPYAADAGELAVNRNMLANICATANVRVLDVAAAVVFENRFNRMVAATRSKAATSFTFVGAHLNSIWQQWGEHHPLVAVDRQSGRMRYRELLDLYVPDTVQSVLEESDEVSTYELRSRSGPARSMTVSFQVGAEERHLPVALASMVAKYTRELMMARFQAYFSERAPAIAPTAGYATDARRFWEEIQPLLGQWQISAQSLRRSV